MVGQIRQTKKRSPRITKRTSGENNLEEELRDADRDNTQVKDCEGDALNQVETGDAQIDDDLMRLLEKLADDKPVIQEKGKEEPKVTILRRSEIVSDFPSKVTNPDGKEVVQSLVEKIPDDIFEQTRVRKKKVAFKEEAEYLGLGQESGE